MNYIRLGVDKMKQLTLKAFIYMFFYALVLFWGITTNTIWDNSTSIPN